MSVSSITSIGPDVHPWPWASGIHQSGHRSDPASQHGWKDGWPHPVGCRDRQHVENLPHGLADTLQPVERTHGLDGVLIKETLGELEHQHQRQSPWRFGGLGADGKAALQRLITPLGTASATPGLRGILASLTLTLTCPYPNTRCIATVRVICYTWYAYPYFIINYNYYIHKAYAVR